MKPAKTIDIFLIDDHKIFLEGLVSLLQTKPELNVVGCAYSAGDYLEKCERTCADVYLVDVNMPHVSGVEIAKHIREVDPKAKILALSMYDDSMYVEKMIQSGASGYVIKSADIDELLSAIKTLAQGETYLGKEVQKQVFDKIDSWDDALLDDYNTNALSRREIEILSLIAREYTTRQIAEKLYISELTVNTHRKNILAKTKAKSIVGLVKYAIREGLVYY